MQTCVEDKSSLCVHELSALELLENVEIARIYYQLMMDLEDLKEDS